MRPDIIDIRSLRPTRLLRCILLAGIANVAGLLANSAAGEPPSLKPEPKVRVVRNVVYATFTSSDGTDDASQTQAQKLRADIYLPARAGSCPAALLLHGGGWATGSKLQMGAYGRRLAQNGVIGVAVDYRLAPRYVFPAQVEDCLKALKWMASSGAEYGIDPQRIAAVGYSAGAHLACLIATTAPSDWGFEPALPEIRAVVAGGAPCNFESLPPDKPLLAYWLGGTRNEVPHHYRKASPLRAVTKQAPPMFFYHGSDDRVVPGHVSQQMANRLRAEGVPVEYFVCDEKGHVSTFFDVEASSRSIAFLERVLMAEVPADRNAVSARVPVSVSQ